MIAEIKEIINKYGYFNTYDLEVNSCPIITTRDNLIHLIEEFYKEYVTVYVYMSGESDSFHQYRLNYENLSKETLKDIYNLCLLFKSTSDKDEASIQFLNYIIKEKLNDDYE